MERVLREVLTKSKNQRCCIREDNMEKSKTCPKCNYTNPDEEFSICPKCGIIIKKFFETEEIRKKHEQERLEKRRIEEEQLRIKQEKEEKEKLRKEQEEAERQRRIREHGIIQQREEERKEAITQTVRPWKRISKGGILTGILGVILLLSGLEVSPTAGYADTVNLHKLHIKQSFYYFSGVCFIISMLQQGIEIILVALADLNQTIRNKI